MSLSELLIGLFLSTFLGSILLQQYAGLSYHSQHQMALFDHQFDQMLLTKIVSDSLHQAGFLPCGSRRVLTFWDACESRWMTRDALSVKSYQISAHYMGRDFQALSPQTASLPLVTRISEFHPGQTILLTNCRYSELNQIASMKPQGHYFQIKLVHPSQFVIDNDSYIGSWHHDHYDYRNGSLFFGDRKKECLANNIEAFKVTVSRPNLIQILWKNKGLPPINHFIWTPNVSKN